ncbi:uncharacterized protein LOC123296755 [Chrysoperla carnea]|uniref:uncharacterized protein LOC123296755 n=1 Tax=Chrysoperla carnea TaxID=189513 RepID=UPI001D06D254|nr:uncharacterized protein LOC123296755 [Chrysoperla carnea]XP_044734333.1 uncharacterized protein LOC123296755 [Chrysoperla carnea]
MGDVEGSRLKSECTSSSNQTIATCEMVNYPQWPPTIEDAVEDPKLEDPTTVSDDDLLNSTIRKRKKSECDDFLGFKKHCIDEATDMYRKCLKYSNTFDIKLENGFEETLPAAQSSRTKSEYAQYLGLQPTVKFKCIKCSTSNFPTLTALNKHLEKCENQSTSSKLNTAEDDGHQTSTPNDADDSSVTKPPSGASSSNSTNFKITRRVYLCSACGVYFEIWKLFLHMRTAHRRYICLICLGLFSIAEKLSNHLIVKHNILAKNYDNLTNFFHDFTGQNFIMCCQCEKMFTEKDNFVEHICEVNGNSQPATATSSTNVMKKITPPKLSETPKINSSPVNKINLKLKNKILPSEHVTADTQEEDATTSDNGIQEKTPDIEPENPIIENTSKIDESKIITSPSSPQPETKEPEEMKNLVNSPVNKMEIEENENYMGNSEIKNDVTKTDNKNEVMLTESTPDEELRRVPKVTLKIPKSDENYVDKCVESDTDSDDSFKLTMEIESNKKCESFPIADTDIPIVELGLRPSLDKITIQSLLKDFIRATCYTCIYCNYARKIAVNGKQLGLHMIAEHRFSATADSITAEELLPETFVKHIQDNFEDLSKLYFNLESYDNSDSQGMIPYDRTYECFQCRFVTTVHKELYLHNRKMHQKTLLLCIMCKSTFYSYSELLCHLCPGVYLGDVSVLFRCCLCPIDSLPSAFRLMVHLRKRHHACDVCLETCNSQSKLSNHVWKHKLHHLCYRCGIAYRNKPDITKHLFWKHGTESVLCKKCLQKKWPHVYHFCIPPTSFLCDECNKVFSTAVALKVHKRLHSNVKPYTCTEPNCTEAFISKKLLGKHLLAHQEPNIPATTPLESDDIDVQDEEEPVTNVSVVQETSENVEVAKDEKPAEEEAPKVIKDVLDLPALNLSESSDSDSEDDAPSQPPPRETKQEEILLSEESDNVVPPPVVIENIWDNFKNYQASVEKRNLSPVTAETDVQKESDATNLAFLLEVIMSDHDYCAPEGQQPAEEHEIKTEKDECCDSKNEKETTTKAASDSSSDSDSSSCSCGSNCSCSSSSSNDSSSSSSSSSDSDSSSSDDGQRSTRKQKRKERSKPKSKQKISETSSNIDVVHVEDVHGVQQQSPPPSIPVAPPVIPDIPIYESDLFTDESETDEDFYDECPQLLAKKLIEEKKNQLLLDVGGPPLSAINGTSFLETSRSSTPNLPVEEHQNLMIKLKKPKNKSKKRKRSQKKLTLSTSSPIRPSAEAVLPPLKLNIPSSFYKSSPNSQNMMSSSTPNTTIPTIPSSGPPVALPPSVPTTPVTLSLSTSLYNSNTGSGSETDSTLRLSKRRRVPNKFYGYSSDEDQPSSAHQQQQRLLNKLAISTEPPQLQWNKEDLPSPRSSNVPETPPYVPAPIIWNTKIATTPPVPPIVLNTPPAPTQQVVPPSSSSSESDAPDSDDDEQRLHISHSPPPALPSVTVPSTPIQPSAPQITHPPPTMLSLNTAPRPTENLYCYCQCPYDEVSEMIACDGKKCAIEWFHFECVGIMVPPKGKWFCPDCRKQTTSSSSSSQSQSTTQLPQQLPPQPQRPEYFMSQ